MSDDEENKVIKKNKKNLDTSQPCYGSKKFYRGILQRNYRKMTIKWSFSYNSFVKLSLDVSQSILMAPKHNIIKGLHCTYKSLFFVSRHQSHTKM